MDLEAALRNTQKWCIQSPDCGAVFGLEAWNSMSRGSDFSFATEGLGWVLPRA